MSQGEEKVTDEQFGEMISAFKSFTESQQKFAEVVEKSTQNKNGGNGAPKNWTELIWKSASTFGIPTVIVGVFVLIAYQTFPDWVKANIQTQQSLTTNLEEQTQNIEAQTKATQQVTATISEVRDTIKQVADDSKSQRQFTEQMNQDHRTQIDSQKKILESEMEQIQQSNTMVETQKQMVTTLESIQQAITNE